MVINIRKSAEPGDWNPGLGNDFCVGVPNDESMSAIAMLNRRWRN
jgi:hypothetical protein